MEHILPKSSDRTCRSEFQVLVKARNKQLIYGQPILNIQDLISSIPSLRNRSSSTIEHLFIQHRRLSEQQYLIKPPLTPKKKSGRINRQAANFRLQRLKTLNQSSSLYPRKTFFQRFLIPQDSNWKSVWDWIFILILFYNLITTLYFLGFEEPSFQMLAVDHATRVVFLVDITLSFMTDRSVAPQVGQQPEIALKYLKIWFLPDLLAVFPFREIGSPATEYSVRLIRLIKVYQFLSIDNSNLLLKLLKKIDRGSDLDIGAIIHLKNAQMIIQLLVAMIFSIYTIACIWYWFQAQIARLDHTVDYFENVYYLKDQSTYRKLIVSSYFIASTMTTVGYGDFFPSNKYQQAFFIIVFIIGVTFFAFVMGLFNTVILEYRLQFSENKRFQELNLWLNQLQKFHGPIPKYLKKQLYLHFTYYFQHDRTYKISVPFWRSDQLLAFNQQYLSEVPLNTKQQILDYIFVDIFYIFRYFFGQQDLKYYLVSQFQPIRYLPDIFIIQEGSRIWDILFVLQGKITCGPVFHNIQTVVLTFSKSRTVIGDHSILTNTLPITSYKSANIVQGYTLNKNFFLRVLNQVFPQEKIRLISLSRRRHIKLKELCRTAKQKLGYHPDYIQGGSFQDKIFEEKKRRTRISRAFYQGKLQKPENQVEQTLQKFWAETGKKLLMCLDVLKDHSRLRQESCGDIINSLGSENLLDKIHQQKLRKIEGDWRYLEVALTAC